MNAAAGCCKTWICNSIHPVALRAVFGNYANGLALASNSLKQAVAELYLRNDWLKKV
jgi:hypothetical protein